MAIYVPYQKCPICEGKGTVIKHPGFRKLSLEKCDVCDGDKIIPMHCIKEDCKTIEDA